MRSATTTRAALAFAALTLSAMPAMADGPPQLDIEKTCRSVSSANLGVSDQASQEGCLRSERQAEAEAKRRWDDYSASAKSQCSKQFEAGGYPSYVEMVTCLELASGTVPTQPSDAGMATDGKGSNDASGGPKAGASTLTKEPAASQRTDPLKVLDKP